MTANTVGAALYVDGGWVADGSGPDDQDPVALSGLSVSWGRATTVDQVEPSTCSFELADPPGGTSFLDLLYVGARVDVTATGTVPAPATLPVNHDPSFEAAALGSDPFGHYNWTGTSAVINTRAATGAQSARLTYDPAGGGVLAGAWIPPAPYDDVDPSAWDDIPRMQLGEEWAATAAVQSPIGGSFGLYLYGFPSPRTSGPGNVPYDTGGRVAGGSGVDAVQSWQTVKIPDQAIRAGAADMWAGLLLRIQLAAWQYLPPVTAGVPNPIPWTDVAGSWQDWATGYVDDVQVLAPTSAGDVHRDVLVFSGRITDLDAGWDDGTGGVVSSVIAADFTADLAQRDVGAEPWPAETLASRFGRIVAAAGVPIPYTIAPTLAAWRISYLDVDRQQAWPLLADLATSVDGILWSATHHDTGPFLWLADPRTSSALYRLEVDADSGLVVIVPNAAAAGVIVLDACDVLRDPVVFRQAVSDVSTRVALSWQDQTTNDAGLPAPTERTDTLIDVAAELVHGTRRVAVSTLLTSAADADAVAALILGRLRVASWRVGGLVWRTDLSEMNGDQTIRVLDLLDGRRRLGSAVILENLPPWSPSGDRLPLLLQGGTYVFEDGQWTLSLVTSSAAAQGTALPWNGVDPAWAWNEFDPTIAWSDLVGVAG